MLEWADCSKLWRFNSFWFIWWHVHGFLQLLFKIICTRLGSAREMQLTNHRCINTSWVFIGHSKPSLQWAMVTSPFKLPLNTSWPSSGWWLEPTSTPSQSATSAPWSQHWIKRKQNSTSSWVSSLSSLIESNCRKTLETEWRFTLRINTRPIITWRTGKPCFTNFHHS